MLAYYKFLLYRAKYIIKLFYISHVWSIQQKLDAEYQKKLKEVNDEAMKKLASYRQEHKQLTERA